MKKISFCFIVSVISYCVSAQGHIDHIKNQPYMRLAATVNCKEPGPDNLSALVCANLIYQKSDSALVVVYEKLLAVQANDSLRNQIIDLQSEWRAFRDKHCKLVWTDEEGANSHPVVYLYCLTQLTENRRKELEAMLPE